MAPEILQELRNNFSEIVSKCEMQGVRDGNQMQYL